MAFSLGETIQDNKYRLNALLDRRQWGMTFLATHQGVDQQVVIKTFRASSGGPSQAQLNSYVDYAQKLTRFHHPNLSRVIGIFEESGHACMVSEFIRGSSLTEMVKEKPLDEKVALGYIRQVAQGIHALHRHGLLHLNLNPHRILKRRIDSQAVLLGLNSRFASQPDERQANPYLALEQYQTPTHVGCATEVYNIAATLYLFVTGQAPVAANHRRQTSLLLPRELRPDVSPVVEAAIMSGLALEPGDRPQQMKEWIQMLPQSVSANENQTVLQIPSAWQIKLPDFQDTTSVSTASSPTSDPTTALQPAPVNLPCSDSVPSDSGHSEPDSSAAEAASVSANPVTEDTSPALVAQTIEASADGSEISPLKNADHNPDMSVARPPKSGRFPKWALLWCAVAAACGGLTAGLWFRSHLTRQFAMPPPSVETSPIDQLRQLETKQEEFLPTQTSIIPEDKSGRYRSLEEEDAYPTLEDFENEDPLSSDALDGDAEAELGEISDDWRAPSPWSAGDRPRDDEFELRPDDLNEAGVQAAPPSPDDIPLDTAVYETFNSDEPLDAESIDIEATPLPQERSLELDRVSPAEADSYEASYEEFREDDPYLLDQSSLDSNFNTL
ncbi:MAG: protein kinase [Cyanobacteria bacterium P01_F01_bin.42]